MSVHLALRGEIDLVSGPEVRASIAGLCAQGLDVVVDVSRVTFLDSSGLRALVGASQDAARAGCRLEIRGARGDVLHTFGLAGLSEHLPFLADAPGPREAPR
ncbi:MAG: STAS domain-containing protein [Solirubrobacteraceae bacterium]